MASFINFDVVEQVYETALNEVSSLTTYVTMVAGIGALLYLSTKIWKQWANGGQIDFYGLLKPFAILLVLLNFSVVPVVLDTLTDPLTTVTKELREEKNEEYNKKVTELAEIQKLKAIETAQNVTKETDWTLKGIYEKLCQIANAIDYLNPVSQGCYWGRQLTSFILSTIIEYLSIAVSSFIIIFAYLTKIILVIIGPLVFALAIFPGFGHVLQQWFCRYINVCLWIPICNIIGYVIQSLYISCTVDNAIKAVEENYTMIEQVYAEDSNRFVGTIFLLIGVFLYFMVPKIADWVISGNGSGMIGDALTSAAGRTAGVATGAVGGKLATKGVAKAIGGAVKGK